MVNSVQGRLQDRLDAVGLTKGQFAEKLGVGASTVSNWIKRGSLPDDARVLLGDLEHTDERIPLGSWVHALTLGSGRVVRRDRCESLFGVKPIQWVYFVRAAQEDRTGAWVCVGPSHRFPEKYLSQAREVEWLDKLSGADG